MIREKKTYYLIYAFFVLLFFAIFYMAHHNYSAQKNTHAEQFTKSQLLIVKQLSNVVQGYINNVKHEFVIFAGSYSMQKDSNVERMRNMLAFYTLKNEDISTIRIYNDDGLLLFALPSRYYKEKMNKDFSGEPFFIHVKRMSSTDKKNIFTSDVHVDDIGERALTLAAPIFSQSEGGMMQPRETNFKGAVVITLKLERIAKLIDDSFIKISDEVYLWALDNSGSIIINSTDPELLGRKIDDVFYANGYEDMLGIAHKMLARQSDKATHRYFHESYYTAFAPVMVGPKNFWSIAIMTPVQLVQKINEENFRHNIIFILLLLTLFITANYVINRVYKRFMEIKLLKEVSEKKHEAEKKYRELFENAANIIFIVDKDKYTLTSFNTCFLRELGLDHEDIWDKSILDLLDDENQRIFTANFKETLKGNNKTYELSIKDKKMKKYKIFSIANTLLIDVDDTKKVQCIGIDITARKELTAELIETKNRLQSVFDGMQVGISLISKNYDVIMVNKFQERLLKMRSGEMTGRKCYEVFRKSKVVCENCPSTTLLESSNPGKSEMKVSIESGREKFYNLFTYPVYDADNEISGFITSVQDITDVKSLETEILDRDRGLEIINRIIQTLNRHKNLDILFNNLLTELLLLLNFSSGVILLNDEESKNIRQKAKSGITSSFVIKLTDLWGSEEIVNEFIYKGEPVIVNNIFENKNISFDMKNLLKRHEIKFLTLLPIRLKRDVIGAIILMGNSNDHNKDDSLWLLEAISNDICMAVESCILREKLSKTADRLKQAKETALEKDKLEAANELAGLTIHELNQPLTTIISYSEFLMSDVSEESNTYQTLKIIAEEAHRILDIIKKLTSLTKYDTKKYISNTKVISIEKVSKED